MRLSSVMLLVEFPISRPLPGAGKHPSRKGGEWMAFGLSGSLQVVSFSSHASSQIIGSRVVSSEARAPANRKEAYYPALPATTHQPNCYPEYG